MIKLSEFEVNSKNIAKIIDKFKNSELNRLNKLYDYYNANNDILKKQNYDNKVNNKLASAYAKYVVKLQTGYFMGVPVKSKSSDEEYLEEYNKILDDNFYTDVNFELAKSAAIFGYACELIYQNENAITKFKKLDPRETILVFGTSMREFLLCGIRYYNTTDLDNNVTEIAEIYTKDGIQYFSKTKNQNEFIEDIDKMQLNLFNDIPIIVYKNNDEMKSDFEDILSLNDAYDTSQSNTANDVDYFNDAYMVINGNNGIEDDDEDENGNGKTSTADKMKKNRMLFFPDGGDAKFLIKEINDSATENYKKRLNNDIHKFSMTPDLADEKFAGNLSGIAIKFKTIPLEESATEKENKFRVGLRKRCELITYMLNTKKNKSYNYLDITEEFTRNLPVNTTELTQTVLSCSEYISRRTLLELLPQIDDVNEELKRIQEEKDEYSKLDYPISKLKDDLDE
ncbi:MAG: phage portal protein [Peptoanaerobacter stomatis]|uniref:phage portal protein n=1 Tax=Peptoanaerobacter stomatis TaxID=796937 RepID=UPI003FA0B588